MKLKNILCGQNAELLIIKAGGTLPPTSRLKMEAVCSSKTLVCIIPAGPHGVTTPTTNMDIFTALRT
jgi:hypothetical protein